MIPSTSNKFVDFLKPFAENQEVVTKDAIESFFEEQKNKAK
jgi:hypothetical protein